MSFNITRHLWVFCLCVFTVECHSGGLLRAQSSRKPNVIIIYTDDQGSVDLNSYGASDLVTPNMDRLAREGVRFTQMYAPAPICSASRAGLLTGRYNMRAGMPGNAGSTRGLDRGLPEEEVLISEMMKAAGYKTAHIGKWHLGYVPSKMPNAQGFDYSFGHMGGCIDNYSHFFYWSGPNTHDLWRNGTEVFEDGRYFGDLMVEEASQFMTENRDHPFFIYYAINMPHYPYQGEAHWLEKFKDLPYPRDLYAAFLATMDDRIGQLLDKINELGLREETIIILQSDHGHSTEERAHWGGGSAGPYRGAKASLFEGGIRVPAVISWPGKLPAGEVRDQLVHGSDWLPTIAELCGVEVLNRDLDGHSIAGVIRSDTEPSPHKVLFWHWSGRNAWAVREGNWKLLGNPTDTTDRRKQPELPELFLVNLAEDVGETKNLAERYPEKVSRMKKLHDEWLRSFSR